MCILSKDIRSVLWSVEALNRNTKSLRSDELMLLLFGGRNKASRTRITPLTRKLSLVKLFREERAAKNLKSRQNTFEAFLEA